MIEHAYIHIPFCKRKCRYCSFVSGENIEYKDIYLKSLDYEIKSNYTGEKLKTLYIGGGTPSLLEVCDIGKIIENFNLNKNTEITLEANPETVDTEKFKGYKDIGINRISLGVQTFKDEILNFINRNHTSKEIKKSIKILQNAGFENISIDLIYGLPYQTFESLDEDINKAQKLGIQHISTYGLQIEENSYFHKNKPEKIPDEDMQAQMYIYICDSLEDFEHYEISNFALKGFESKHNCAYWLNKEYWGFGVNAAGYKNNVRYKNTPIFSEYVKNPNKKEEKIKLTKQETLENEIFLALRLKQGINISKINKKYGIDFLKKYEKIISKYSALNLLERTKNRLKLTRRGVLLSNEIMSEFIF